MDFFSKTNATNPTSAIIAIGNMGDIYRVSGTGVKSAINTALKKVAKLVAKQNINKLL